jgi:hypothetical protein
MAADKRHTRIMKVIHEPIEAREFGEWTMGRADLSMNGLGEVSARHSALLRRQVLSPRSSPQW